MYRLYLQFCYFYEAGKSDKNHSLSPTANFHSTEMFAIVKFGVLFEGVAGNDIPLGSPS